MSISNEVSGIEIKEAEREDGYEKLLKIYQDEQRRITTGEYLEPTVMAFFQEDPEGMVIKRERPKYLLDSNTIREGGPVGLHRGCSDLGVAIVAKIDKHGYTNLAKEARKLARIEHPNVVTVYDFLANQGPKGVIIMREVGGGSLNDVLNEIGSGHRQLCQDELINLIDGVGRGLSYLQSKGLAHQDLHPGNIMYSNEGDVKIVDLGYSEEQDSPQRNVDAWYYLKDIFELISGRPLGMFKEHTFIVKSKKGDFSYEGVSEKINKRCNFSVSSEQWNSFVEMMAEEAEITKRSEVVDGGQVERIRRRLLDIFKTR